MKSLAIMLGLIAVIVILFTACVSPPEIASKSDVQKSNVYNSGWNTSGAWKVVKSPLTGRCYEIFDKLSVTRDSALGMSGIPCSEYEKLKDK